MDMAFVQHRDDPHLFLSLFFSFFPCVPGGGVRRIGIWAFTKMQKPKCGRLYSPFREWLIATSFFSSRFQAGSNGGMFGAFSPIVLSLWTWA